MNKHIIIVGGGFAGLNAAKVLGNAPGISVTIIDRRNHHLFQPLLYQVAMAGLSPADIAVPIRKILSKYVNIQVLNGEVEDIDLKNNRIITNFDTLDFDYLILACGARHSYFGNSQWEKHAPGLKNISQATEIRRRVLIAFEKAERSKDPEYIKKMLTFSVIGAGPTGVELAGAIAEMSHYTLAKEFKNIDASQTRVLLFEGGPRVLPTFTEKSSKSAEADLKKLGVEVHCNTFVNHIDADTVKAGEESYQTATVLWAAGVKASRLGKKMGVAIDKQGRVIVQTDFSISENPNIFVVGDQANYILPDGGHLPGQAPAASQAGRYVAKAILAEVHGKERPKFKYLDKGQMATIGRSKAVAEIKGFQFKGFFAWLLWLFIHIYFLTGFKNRIFVLSQWAWSYLTFGRNARLIVNKRWTQESPVKRE
jgi:NADH dehydrogenase